MALDENGNEISQSSTTPGSGDEGRGDKVLAEVQGQVGVLTKAMTLMAQSQQETQDLLKNLPDMLKTVHSTDDKGGDRTSAGDLFDGVDLDTLDRKEYGTLLLTKFMDRLSVHLDDKLKPITSEVASVKETVASDLGSRQISDALTVHRDLYEWKDEIATLLKETPNMKLTRALIVAKSENPEKATAMQKKYAVVNGEDKNKVRYLGMTPTSRTSGDDGGKGKMKFAEAAEHAFDDVVASFGGSSFDQLMGGGRR